MRCATSAGHSSGTRTLRRFPRAGVISVTSSHRMMPTEYMSTCVTAGRLVRCHLTHAKPFTDIQRIMSLFCGQ